MALLSTWFGPMAPGPCGELVLPTLRWQWLVTAAGGGGLSSSSLGEGVGGSSVYLRQRGKHQWEQRTMAILLGRLAQCGWQHDGVAVAKTVAGDCAQFGWGNLFPQLVSDVDSNPTQFSF
jgi:hypothetical protein